MSYLAIGAVTKAMIELLSKKLNKPALLGAGTFRVTSLPPDDDRVTEDTGVNLFLYRLSENPHLKNMPWVGDRAHPNGSNRPPLALTMNYILTGYAKKVAGAAVDDITAHQLLGNAMSILHDYPVLNDVHDSDFDADVDAQFAAELRQAYDKVKISLMPISIDEFSKIWTGFSKAYRLSVAYEVSLVQIAPLAPSLLPAPLALRPAVHATTIGAPSIASITPESGPTGVQVTLSGGNFTQAGSATTLTVGAVTLEQADLDQLTSNTIVFTVPAAVSGGPRIPITVACGGRESNAATYEVQPWVSGLTPLRGNTGVPIALPFTVPAAAVASLEIGGTAVATTVDAAAGTVSGVVPLALTTNGPTPVVLIVNDGVAHRSNTLLYEILPAITAFTLTNAGAPAVSTLTVTGERLRGSAVTLRYLKLSIAIGDTTDVGAFPSADTTVSFTFDRVVPPGGSVVVLVDGRQSNTLPPVLLNAVPPQGSTGDNITLSGSGLSGRSVVVSFGATVLPAVAQPFASRFSVRVPAGLAVGATTIGLTVDGTATNTVPFQVVP
jgi:hypothetical protein